METFIIAASSGTNIAPLILSALAIGVLFFFMIVRPQKKNLARHKEMVAQLKSGDEIITSGGIYGTIKSVDSDSVMMEVADGIQIKVATRAVAMKKAPDTSDNSQDQK